MVFKKLLAGLGFGGVEVDTVLTSPSTRPGEPLTGQVNLRAKGDAEITSIQLLIMAGHGVPGQGEVELARYTVAGGLRLAGGSTQSIPFTVDTPWAAPVTVLSGQRLPGISVGVRTEVAVSSGSAKTDVDPAGVEPTAIHQQVLDALGMIGCRFVRNELRPGAAAGLPAAAVQAITFYAPAPGGQVGPHIPQLVFAFAANTGGLTVIAELAGRPGSGERHHVTTADAQQLSGQESGWVDEVDRWVCNVLEKLSQAPAGAGSGAFLQPPQQTHPAHPAPGYGHGQQPYAYAGHGHGHGSYKYSGHRSSGMGGAIAAGVGGAALGFLGGMVIADMMAPDAAGDVDTGGAEDQGVADAGYDDGGGFDDFGGEF